MALSDSLRLALQEQDLDTIEAEWLELMAEQPVAVGDFVKVAETIHDINPGLAKILLELLDDQLQAQGEWADRLDLVRGSGRHYLKPGTIHQAVLNSLRQLYTERADDVEMLMSELGLGGGKDEAPKLWDKVERLRNLLTYEIGTVVAMTDKGVGRVVEVNLTLQTLKVDFDKQRGVAVGFRAAGKMLELLDEGHVLRRKLEAPEALTALEPAELLRMTLESYARPLSGAEVRAAVEGVLGKRSWASWWGTARKHPQVVTSGSSRRLYSWAKTTEHAEETLWEEFDGADVATQTDLLRRAGNQEPELRDRMARRLGERLQQSLEERPAQALEIWAALERQPGGAAWDPATLVASLPTPLSFLAEIGQRSLRDRAYRLVREIRDDWQEVLEARFLQETDPRSLALLLGLVANEDQEAADSLVDQAVNQWLRAPAAFVFVAERAAEDEALRTRHSLRLLKQILATFGDRNFAEYRSRLVALLESGGTLPRLLSLLDQEQAAQADEALERAAALPDYQRRPLINALHLRFPELRREEQQPLYATAGSLAKKREELRQLLEEEIPANRRAIEEARAMGDLRENFEYKSARQRHEYLSARATSLSQDIERVQILDFASIDPSEIRIGACATLSGKSGERRITILGPWESSPENNIVSFESELAQQLLGKKIGEQVSLADDEMAITAIEVLAPEGE